MKGYTDDNRDIAMRYKNHIKENRDIPFAKLDSINSEVTHSNPKEDMYNSLAGPSDTKINVSHSKTSSAKEVQKNNTRVSMFIVDANQSSFINPNHNNNKIQQNSSYTTRRTTVFKSSICGNNITKGSIRRLHVAKVDSYGNEKDLTPTLHSTERVITNNKEKHTVIDNEGNIARDYVYETKIIHPNHFCNTKTKLKPTTGLNKISELSLYSSIGYDSSLAEKNITITHKDPRTITDNDDHVQTEYKYLLLQQFSESFFREPK